MSVKDNTFFFGGGANFFLGGGVINRNKDSTWSVPDGPVQLPRIEGPVPLLVQVVANLKHVG